MTEKRKMEYGIWKKEAGPSVLDGLTSFFASGFEKRLTWFLSAVQIAQPSCYAADCSPGSAVQFEDSAGFWLVFDFIEVVIEGTDKIGITCEGAGID